jgi:hypothetical protein
MDNTLYTSLEGDVSNGAGQFLFAGTIASSLDARRGLVAFDVASSLPTNAIVSSVTLTLHMSRTISGAQSVSLHRITQRWGEGPSNATGQEGMGAVAAIGDATWLHAVLPEMPWTTPGGDFVDSPSATDSVAGTGYYTFGSTQEMVSDVQSWLNNPTESFGWLLLGEESVSGSAKRFDSREHPTPSNRPLLMIEFTTIPEPSSILVAVWLFLPIVWLVHRTVCQASRSGRSSYQVLETR